MRGTNGTLEKPRPAIKDGKDYLIKKATKFGSQFRNKLLQRSNSKRDRALQAATHWGPAIGIAAVLLAGLAFWRSVSRSLGFGRKD